MHHTSTKQIETTIPASHLAARALLAALALGGIGFALDAGAQCTTLVRESFRPGPRPHGNNGRPREAQIHDSLSGYWPQSPSGVMWISSDQSGVPTWGFAGSSLDPAEVDPEDPYNGTAFGDAGATALLPFVRPGAAFTATADVVMGQMSDAEVCFGYTPSAALLNNLSASGALWVSLNGFGDWAIYVNGSTPVLEGNTPLWGEMGSGWLHVELTFDPSSSSISGRIMNQKIPSTPVPSVPPSAYFAIETHHSWGVVNNLTISTGASVSAVASGGVATGPGQTVTLTGATNAQSPEVSGWSRDWIMLGDGVQPDGSVISGSSTQTLTISNTRAGDSGAYRFHAANACGSAISPPTTLTICVADVTGSDGVDLADFFAFLNAFDTGDPAADVDEFPGVDLGDFFAFLNAFDAGC